MRIPPQVESLEVSKCPSGDRPGKLSSKDESSEGADNLDVHDVRSMKVIVRRDTGFHPVTEWLGPDEVVHRG